MQYAVNLIIKRNRRREDNYSNEGRGEGGGRRGEEDRRARAGSLRKDMQKKERVEKRQKRV